MLERQQCIGRQPAVSPATPGGASPRPANLRHVSTADISSPNWSMSSPAHSCRDASTITSPSRSVLPQERPHRADAGELAAGCAAALIERFQAGFLHFPFLLNLPILVLLQLWWAIYAVGTFGDLAGLVAGGGATTSSCLQLHVERAATAKHHTTPSALPQASSSAL